MPVPYVYELWNGKKVVGFYTTSFAITGNYIVIPVLSLFKQFYNKRYEFIKIPIVYDIQDDGVTVIMKRRLDVRKKSKRQIDIILRKS